MYSWKYRAYDVDRKVHEGITEAKDFQSLALLLRQSGLCILEATKLNPDDALAHQRLKSFKNRVEKPLNPLNQQINNTTDHNRIRQIFKSLIKIFRR